VHLVSHSVPGLDSENVTVVDTQGFVLTDLLSNELFTYVRGSDGRTVVSLQQDAERQREGYLEKKAKDILIPAFGSDKVVVRIKVDLDFDKRTLSTREFIPNETGRGVPRSQQNMEESYTGTGTPPGGTPGTTTNIPGYAINAQSVESEYNKSETTTNYEITTRESNEVVTPGTIRRMTASVIVDGDMEPRQLEEYKSLVASAIGFNEARGDSLVFLALKFSTSFADILVAEMARERMWRLAIIGSGLLTLLLVGGGVFWWWWRRRKAQEALLNATKDAKHIPTIQEMLTSPELIVAQGEIAVLEEQLKSYARSNPKEVANLINEWLSED
jgi:flagellar M-ring protein FliF